MPESPERCHYIRIEFPPDASETDIDRVRNAVIDVKEGYEDEFDYDIFVSGGAWYPPEDEDESDPYLVAKGNLRRFIYEKRSDNSPTDAFILLGLLAQLHELGMSQLDLHIHLERERAMNEVALRNMQVEKNLLAALDMVTGNVSPQMQVKFQPGTT